MSQPLLPAQPPRRLLLQNNNGEAPGKGQVVPSKGAPAQQPAAKGAPLPDDQIAAAEGTNKAGPDQAGKSQAAPAAGKGGKSADVPPYNAVPPPNALPSKSRVGAAIPGVDEAPVVPNSNGGRAPAQQPAAKGAPAPLPDDQIAAAEGTNKAGPDQAGKSQAAPAAGKGGKSADVPPSNAVPPPNALPSKSRVGAAIPGVDEAPVVPNSNGGRAPAQQPAAKGAPAPLPDNKIASAEGPGKEGPDASPAGKGGKSGTAPLPNVAPKARVGSGNVGEGRSAPAAVGGKGAASVPDNKLNDVAAAPAAGLGGKGVPDPLSNGKIPSKPVGSTTSSQGSLVQSLQTTSPYTWVALVVVAAFMCLAVLRTMRRRTSSASVYVQPDDERSTELV